MRSTFKVLFYVKKGSEKPNGNLPLMSRSYTPKQMEDTIIKLLDQWQRKQQRQNER